MPAFCSAATLSGESSRGTSTSWGRRSATASSWTRRPSSRATSSSAVHGSLRWAVAITSSMAGAATVAAAVRCLYVDLDGTLLGPDASLVRGADGRWSSLGFRALEACWRAEVEVVLFSGRKQSSVFEASRLIGASSYIFELGCGLVLDGELEWLTGDFVPSTERGSISDQITATGAPELLLDHFNGRLEYHTPWATGREVSHLFRGSVDLEEVAELLAGAGIGTLRLVDNGVIREHAGRFLGVDVVRAYHLVPAVASKARAVARHMQARG